MQVFDIVGPKLEYILRVLKVSAAKTKTLLPIK